MTTWPSTRDLGPVLTPGSPTAPNAPAIGLAHQYVSGDHTFYIGFLGFCSDHYRDKTWPQAMLALLELLAQTPLSAHRAKNSPSTGWPGDVNAARAEHRQHLSPSQWAHL
jgi:hypothetical protein